jgi:uncharacterized protein (UPF0264 family)
VRLLVSVSNAAEASAALIGGADIIDAKNPRVGALGAVTPAALRQIVIAVGGSRPVSAALGDADDAEALARRARIYAESGAAFVKIGFGGITRVSWATSLLTAAVRSAEASRQRCEIIAVAYADADPLTTLTPASLADAAAGAGAAGILLDTLDKQGPGLSTLVDPPSLRAWVDRTHALGLIVALAGKLTVADLPLVRSTGADIAGVRGAVCETVRTSRVAADKVRLLRRHLMADASYQ